MKLISMTDFVLEQKIKDIEVQSLLHQQSSRVDKYNKIIKYAEFLKQPLNLGMFVPCDEYGIVKEPTFDSYMQPKEMDRQIDKFQRFNERVLFKGYKVVHNTIMDDNGNYLDTSRLKGRAIESLIGCDLELTENAVKKYNLT